MAPETANTIVRELIAVLRLDLEEAAALALAAEVCAERRAINEATEIANKIDGFTHDAGQIFAVVALIGRRFMSQPQPDQEHYDG